jgi:uncharacterized membrane protein HdeD (DUF308 family)
VAVRRRAAALAPDDHERIVAALSGALSLIFGTVMMVFPRASALALVMWIAAYAFLVGILLSRSGVGCAGTAVRGTERFVMRCDRRR